MKKEIGQLFYEAWARAHQEDPTGMWHEMSENQKKYYYRAECDFLSMAANRIDEQTDDTAGIPTLQEDA